MGFPKERIWGTCIWTSLGVPFKAKFGEGKPSFLARRADFSECLGPQTLGEQTKGVCPNFSPKSYFWGHWGVNRIGWF